MYAVHRETLVINKHVQLKGLQFVKCIYKATSSVYNKQVQSKQWAISIDAQSIGNF